MRLPRLSVPSATALAALAFAAMVASLPAPASAAEGKYAAKNKFKVCFLNKAWVVWEVDARIRYMEYTRSLAGPMVLTRNVVAERFKLALNQSKCFQVASALGYSVEFKHHYGNGAADYASGELGGDATIRLDGTGFNAWVSKWPGAHES